MTGAAGFIGSHLGERLLREGGTVVGFDNFNDFYDPGIKRANAAELARIGGDRFCLVEGDLRSAGDVATLFERVPGRFDLVHLAAMAGVRPSIDDPMVYQTVNVTGTYVLLEAARRRDLGHYVFGSSSSVYGGCRNLPFREDERSLDPVSPYAATKLIGEQIAYCYHECHGVDATCLRFFTVFGPRQRPEMAIHQFARAIRDDTEIVLFGDGATTRDYTYVDDIVDGICGALERPGGFRIFNLGGGHRIALLEMVKVLEQAMGRPARVRHDELHPGDMEHTLAEITAARDAFGFTPSFPFARGVARFVDWFTALPRCRDGVRT